MKDYENIKNRVLDLMGIKDYNPRCRKNDFVIARTLIANLLLRIGYNQIEVGGMLGLDHSNIYYYKEKLFTWEAFPGIYEREVNLWNEIKESI